MIDSFEARLLDVIADRLVDTTEIVSVTRLRAGVPAPEAQGPSAAVAVLSARPDHELGDDTLELLGPRGGRQERPVLRLAGEVLVRVAQLTAASDAQRSELVRALDRLLLALHDESIRTGAAFETDEDQGFALDGGFRLARVVAPTQDAALDVHRFDVVYAFAGRFWPVQTPLAGPAIATIPTRLSVLPMRLPVGLSARAGAGALAIEVPVDLRAWDGALPSLAARLRGASPAGGLSGDSTGLPAGFVHVPVIDGSARLQLVPAAALASAAHIDIDIVYAGAGSALLVLATLRVEVLP